MNNVISYAIASILIGASAFNSFAQAQPIEKGPKITFEKETHDYGEVKYDGDGYYTFVFENTGNEPIVLGDVKGSCSCTVPEWPKVPIAPGEKGEIRVKYDTKKPGAINKSVTVMSNAINSPTLILRIKGNVLPKPESGAPVDNSGAPAQN